MLKYKKKIKMVLKPAVACLAAVLCTLFIFTPVSAENDNLPDKEIVIEQQADTTEIKTIGEQLEKNYNKEVSMIIGEFNPREIIKESAKGNFKLNLGGIINRGLKYLLKELYTNIGLLVKLLVLVVLCAVLKNLQTSFLSESVGELAFFVCYVVIVSILFVGFNQAMELGIEAIDKMVGFMYATLPVMITLLVSGGNFTSGGIFQPLLIAAVEIAATVIKSAFLPVILVSAVLSIVDNISESINLSKLASFLRQAALWALGLLLTVFIAMITIQGSVAALADGIAGKTAKFAIGFIPVVGGYLSDAADTVIGCTLLIKNSAGLAVMIGVVIACLIPLIKIIALIILFRITCVLVEPISDRRITDCINQIANSVTYVLGIVASVTFMFLISLTALISAGNLSAMIR
jgi:stage III sporulation protein AE